MSDEKSIDIVETLISGVDATNQVDPSQLKQIREFVDKFKPTEEMSKGKGYIAQAYVAARKSKSFTGISIAKALNMNYTVYKRYLETDPEFAAAVRLGIMDGKSEMKDALLESLYKKALGYTTIEESTQQDGTIASDGTEFYSKISKKTSQRDVPPDSQALLLLLQKIDPTWAQKTDNNGVDMSEGLNNIVKDVTVDVDYKKLSATALKELLLSEKAVTDKSLNYTEDGTNVLSLYPARQSGYNPKPVTEWNTKINKRKWSEATKEAARAKRAETLKKKREAKLEKGKASKK